MRILAILLTLSSMLCAANSYSNSTLRNPSGNYTLSLGGISSLSECNNFKNNPSITNDKKLAFISYSQLSFDKTDISASFSSKIKNKLGVSVSYSTKSSADIALRSSDEVEYVNIHEVGHYFNINGNFTIVKKSRSELTIGFGINLSKEYLGEQIESDKIVNGFNLGANYKINNMEISTSLLNIAAEKVWANDLSRGETIEKELRTEEIPKTGIIGAKYTIAEKVSILAEGTLEDVTTERYHSIYRAGVIVHLTPISVYAGYGDERASFGLGYKHSFDKTDIMIHSAVSTDKLDGGLYSIGVGLGF